MPAKLLVVNVTRGSPTKFVGGQYPVAWNYTLTVTPQLHSDLIVDPDGYYDGRDIQVGDYFTTTNGGKALRVMSIGSANTNTVTCVAEDINQINGKLDPNQGYESAIPNGVGILFEVVNGLPVIYPLPNALPGTFDKTFSVQLLNRFESLKLADTLPENILTSDDYDVASGVPQLDGNAKLDVSKLVGLNKTAVGLGNVDNTSDANKPISSLTQTALNTKINSSLINAANGVAGLDGDGLIPANKIPGSFIVVLTNYSELPATGETGKLYVISAIDKIYVWTGATYVELAGEGATPEGYTNINLTENATLVNKQVVTLLADDLVLTLPAEPDYGDEIIILNSYEYTYTLTTGLTLPKATIDDSVNDYIVDAVPAIYLLYINGWRVSNSNNAISITVNSDAKSTDYYWPVGTVHEIAEEVVYGGKQAFIETWRNSVGGVIMAQQVTIFNDYANSDNFRQIWNPRDGLSLEKVVNFTNVASIIDLPAVSYVGSLVFSLARLPEMNLNWRDYETFEQLINVSDKFFAIIGSQDIINLLTSNNSFLIDFTEAAADKAMQLPIGPLTGNINSSIYGQVISVNGVTIISANTANYDTWKMFDENSGTYWESELNEVTNQVITFRLPSSKELFPHTLIITTSDPLKCPKNVKLTCTVDSTIYDVGTFILDNSKTVHTFKLTTAGIQAKTWTFAFEDNWGDTDHIRVNEIKMLGWDTFKFV
jgi:hypothetical protein